jgi:hypothetical protein
MDKELLTRIHRLLEKAEATNEATEYDPANDELLDALARIAREEGETAIVEDFEKPFVHPMITVQTWVKELKQLVERRQTSVTP